MTSDRSEARDTSPAGSILSPTAAVFWQMAGFAGVNGSGSTSLDWYAYGSFAEIHRHIEYLESSIPFFPAWSSLADADMTLFQQREPLTFDQPVGTLPVVDDARWSAAFTGSSWGALLAWTLLLILLQLVGWPIVRRMFTRLPDRGWAFARLLTMLVAGYMVWFLSSRRLSQISTGPPRLPFVGRSGRTSCAWSMRLKSKPYSLSRYSAWSPTLA